MKKKLNSHINNIYIFFFNEIVVQKKKKKNIYIYINLLYYIYYIYKLIH